MKLFFITINYLVVRAVYDS